MIFLLETHHVAVPVRSGWKVIGRERSRADSAGGILALARQAGKVELGEPDYAFDGFMWLPVRAGSFSSTIGAAYVPGPSDYRFRSLQGQGHQDHFDALTTQLSDRVDQFWLIGGDFNAITGAAQPLWGPRDPLDHLAAEVEIPARTSDDKRPLSSHGKRLLRSLTDRGVILNGLTSLGFSGAFTRMPNQAADSPGVIDYVIGPPAALRALPYGGLRILDSPPDLSDHHPSALLINIGAYNSGSTNDAQHFTNQRLPALKIPEDAATWDSIEQDVAAELDSTTLTNSLQRCLDEPGTSQQEAQCRVDIAINVIITILYRVFEKYKLVKKRSFGASPCSPSTRKAAPPNLRRLRASASRARRTFVALTRTGASLDALTSAKRSWNRLSALCRAESRAVKARMCTEWRSLWSQLRRSAPRQLWSTFRKHTRQQVEEAMSTPDQQWEHWASQGEVQESVWNDSIHAPAVEWIEALRSWSPDADGNEAASTAELQAAAKRLRPGRAPGIDGVPADVISRLQGLLHVVTLLFSIMLKFSVYPATLGTAIIRGILKPGKPRNLASSLRGIRLLCSLAAWFGQIVDQRARRLWQAGREQFGFRSAVGCMEAVAVLLALIQSRTTQKRRLLVLWVDLRTAFPSLNRAILIRRVFQCGLGLGYCKLLLSIFDATVSILCIGSLVRAKFRESLGTREGAVESPHLFNIYIGDLRQRLEQQHPRLCQLMHITIAVLLYADDAALPADTAEDLALSASIFEQFCNDMHLYV